MGKTIKLQITQINADEKDMVPCGPHHGPIVLNRRFRRILSCTLVPFSIPFGIALVTGEALSSNNLVIS